ncbi:MAG: hypothetical protein AABY07_00885 [Nanoarchaeota archaeon]
METVIGYRNAPPTVSCVSHNKNDLAKRVMEKSKVEDQSQWSF